MENIETDNIAEIQPRSHAQPWRKKLEKTWYHTTLQTGYGGLGQYVMWTQFRNDGNVPTQYAANTASNRRFANSYGILPQQSCTLYCWCLSQSRPQTSNFSCAPCGLVEKQGLDTFTGKTGAYHASVLGCCRTNQIAHVNCVMRYHQQSACKFFGGKANAPGS